VKTATFIYDAVTFSLTLADVKGKPGPESPDPHPVYQWDLTPTTGNEFCMG